MKKASEKILPKHEKLAQVLVRQIHQGGLKPHDRLPTEQELVARHRLSADTVRKALASLEQQGYLYRKPRLGSFVAPRRNRGAILVVFRANLDPSASGGGLWNHAELNCLLSLSFLRQKGECEFEIHFTHEGDFLASPVTDLKLLHPELAAVFFFRSLRAATLAAPELRAMQIPFLFYGSSAHLESTRGMNRLLYDEKEITRLALEALASQGHRGVAVLFTEAPPMSTRRDHFREWMGEQGFPCPETSFLNLAVPSASDALLWRLTRERRGVTALFSTGDEFILEAMNLLPREGIWIPRDLSIVSVNRAPACDLVRPRLSTVEIPIAEDARRAVGALEKLIDGGVASVDEGSRVTLFAGETIAAPPPKNPPSPIPMTQESSP